MLSESKIQNHETVVEISLRELLKMIKVSNVADICLCNCNLCLSEVGKSVCVSH